MVKVRSRSTLVSLALLSSVLALACGGKQDGDGSGSGGQVVGLAGNGASAAAPGSGGTGSGATSGAIDPGTGLPNGVCNNGDDDDGDGLIDGFDPECTGPADNDEATFATGIPGDNRDPKWQDCFFDGNSGAGDDGCRYHTDCLYGTIDQDAGNCQLTEQCVDYCRELTPNGCDCFGCCTVRERDGTNVDILMQPACSLEKLDDAAACPRCTKSADCQNTCGRCELCPGKTEADLPDDCMPDPPDPPPDGGTPPDPPPSYTCEGAPVCTLSGDCASGQYCQLGCCRVVIR